MAVSKYRVKDVFVSYSRDSTVKEFVRRLKSDLEEKQLSVWLDEEDIQAGTEWPVEIGRALRECKALIPVLTKKYVTSSFCKSELCSYVSQNKPVFPIIREKDWDASEKGEGVKFMIGAYNWVRFLPCDDYAFALQKLVDGLKERVGHSLQTSVDRVIKQGMLYKCRLKIVLLSHLWTTIYISTRIMHATRPCV